MPPPCTQTARHTQPCHAPMSPHAPPCPRMPPHVPRQRGTPQPAARAGAQGGALGARGRGWSKFLHASHSAQQGEEGVWEVHSWRGQGARTQGTEWAEGRTGVQHQIMGLSVAGGEEARRRGGEEARRRGREEERRRAGEGCGRAVQVPSTPAPQHQTVAWHRGHSSSSNCHSQKQEQQAQ